MASAPIPQEMIAAGPAAMSAFWAPKSQPEPIIEPPEAQSSPMKPISRRRPGRRGVGAPTGRPATAVSDAAVFIFPPSSVRLQRLSGGIGYVLALVPGSLAPPRPLANPGAAALRAQPCEPGPFARQLCSSSCGLPAAASAYVRCLYW